MKLTENKLKQLILQVLKEEMEPARVTAEYQAMMDEFDEQLKAAVGEENYNKIKNLEKDEPEQAAELARVYVGNKYPQRLGGSDLIDRVMFSKGYMRTSINTEFEDEEYFFGLMKKKVIAIQKRRYQKRSSRSSIDMFRSAPAVGDNLVLEIRLNADEDVAAGIGVKMRASVPNTERMNVTSRTTATIEGDFRVIKSIGVGVPELEDKFPQDEKQVTEMHEETIVKLVERIWDYYDDRVEEIKKKYNIQ
tara:strand:+ start:171 stop:917 length:747 start_codon:yes stop_codon:yes gene_type:complete